MHNIPITVILLFFLAGITASVQADQGAAANKKAPRVVVAPVVRQSVPLRLEYIGNIKAWKSAAIKARVTGYVLSYHFREGEDVKKGQQLFSIDPRPFKATLDKAKAQRVEHQAELAYAREQVARYKGLAQDEFITRDVYDGYRTSAAALKAQVEADRAAIALARINLDYCSISAPFNGRAGKRLIDPGNLVAASGGPDDPTLVVIKQINPIKAIFAVPEKDLQRIREANRAKTLAIDVTLASLGDRVFSGELWLIDNRIDPATGMIEVEGKLPNPDDVLWSGQFVTVAIRIGTQPDTLMVPTAAIALGQHGSFVFTVSAEGKVAMQLIGTGETVGNDTVITHGLEAGERVVVEGHGRAAVRDAGGGWYTMTRRLSILGQPPSARAITSVAVSLLFSGCLANLPGQDPLTKAPASASTPWQPSSEQAHRHRGAADASDYARAPAIPDQAPVHDGELQLPELVDIALRTSPETRETWAAARAAAAAYGAMAFA